MMSLGVAIEFEAGFGSGFGVVAVAGFEVVVGFWLVVGFDVVGLGNGFVVVTEFGVGFAIVFAIGAVVEKTELAG